MGVGAQVRVGAAVVGVEVVGACGTGLAVVGMGVGEGVGRAVGSVGCAVGEAEGPGFNEGVGVGFAVGTLEGASVGEAPVLVASTTRQPIIVTRRSSIVLFGANCSGFCLKSEAPKQEDLPAVVLPRTNKIWY